jgi:hypothetical protein
MPSRDGVQLTPDWSEAKSPVARKAALGEYIPVAEQQSDNEFDLPVHKEKTKTKGTANDEPAAPPAEPGPSPSHVDLHFILIKKPYQTFSNLIYEPTTSSQPGKIL